MNLWWKLRGLALVLVIALLSYGIILALKTLLPDAQQGNKIRTFY